MIAFVIVAPRDSDGGVSRLAMNSPRESRTERPDALALIGPDYDLGAAEPAGRTLIICSAPRTGSYELCRYLLAAGIGVPHEYFNLNYARLLGERWAFPHSPLAPSELGRYVEVLRRRRAQGGVFATKLQFPHFYGYLRNEHGRRLFDGAAVVHLFRPDAAAQYFSYRTALESGIWDYSNRPTTQPMPQDTTDFERFFNQAMRELDVLMGQDAGFRCAFTLLGIRPLFITTDDLFADPHQTVRKIADSMQLPVNTVALDRAITQSAPYRRDPDRSSARLAEHFRRVAFGGP